MKDEGKMECKKGKIMEKGSSGVKGKKDALEDNNAHWKGEIFFFWEGDINVRPTYRPLHPAPTFLCIGLPREPSQSQLFCHRPLDVVEDVGHSPQVVDGGIQGEAVTLHQSSNTPRAILPPRYS